MATVDDVAKVMDVICSFYGKNGEPVQMNAVQRAAYFDGLQEFSSQQLEAAAKQWIATSKWYPMLSDLRELIEPKVNWNSLGHLAWTTFERAIRRAGIYRGATFEDPAIGECVRQTFGSWPAACQYDTDSPGWAMRKQTFLAIFPDLASRATEPVTLRGLSTYDEPVLIAHVDGFPEPLKLAAPKPSVDAMAEVRRRFELMRGKDGEK